MRRQPTEEQKAKAAARRERFRAMWKQVANMPEQARIEMSNKLGFVSVEGRSYSVANMMLLAMQNPGGSVFGGFRQWLKNGRAVKKGEHGSMIWVPVGGKQAIEAPASEPAAGEAAEAAERRFIIGTVFDIGQTDELDGQAVEEGAEA